LKSFEIKAIALAEELPVEIPDVIPGGIFPVLGELDREARVRTSLKSADRAFDDPPRLQLQASKLSERLRIEVRARIVHPGGPPRYRRESVRAVGGRFHPP